MSSEPSSNLSAFLSNAHLWSCPECHQYCQPGSPQWRWNGQNWEHHHGYPVGHITAIRLNTTKQLCSAPDCREPATWQDALHGQPIAGRKWCTPHAIQYRDHKTVIPFTQ